MNHPVNPEILLSLPPASAPLFNSLHAPGDKNYFAECDPPGIQLGSGGGTSHLLHQAWKDSRHSMPFESWLTSRRKLLIHGSGESRRLPAYAAEGKLLTPLPAFPGETGQHPLPALLHMQLSAYERIMRLAPASHTLMITCGDVLLTFDEAPPMFPEADIVIVGIQAPPEECSHHGVMFCPSDQPGNLSFFLQKPSAQKVRKLSRRYAPYLDTGVWILNARAIDMLLRRTGWNRSKQRFAGERPRYMDLFGELGPALGTSPISPNKSFSNLTAAVLPFSHARFLHFGTNRSLLASVSQLLAPPDRERSVLDLTMEGRSAPLVLNSNVSCPISSENSFIWIENSCVPDSWRLSQRHVITGVPPNKWEISMPPGTCLSFAPVGRSEYCIRFYGFDDAFRGPAGTSSTLLMHRPLSSWLKSRGLTCNSAGIDEKADIHSAALFPVLPLNQITSGLLNWLINGGPDAGYSRIWLSAKRLSGANLLRQTAIRKLHESRMDNIRALRKRDGKSRWLEICAGTNMALTADFVARGILPTPPAPAANEVAHSMPRIHDLMFNSEFARRSSQPARAARFEKRAFEALCRLVVEQMELKPVDPRRNVHEDQLVWGRSPLRLDIAGGWSDTPPYCIEYGGRVVNVAVELNGQAPVQVFARFTRTPVITIRSIDLGITETIKSYDELMSFGRLGSGFGIARAALALSGLGPRFNSKPCRTLHNELLSSFDGGIEISMVCAVPKGSGLGTSSILAATTLGTLSELCGHMWDPAELSLRTLALEQMLGSGGGWQDQLGGIAAGVKLIETRPSLVQRPEIRWLPATFFDSAHANVTVLLYYTGITRIAHDILGEIVRGLFLNSTTHLEIIHDIKANADFTANALQQNNWDGLSEAIRRSWTLNQCLDRGTNPPAVAAILKRIEDYILSAKLLGAGGGGYLLILAKDEVAAGIIRRDLTQHPSTPSARFVNLSLSQTGFQVTRS